MEKIWSKLIHESMCILLYTNDTLTKKKERQKEWRNVADSEGKDTQMKLHSIPQIQPEVASSPAQMQA